MDIVDKARIFATAAHRAIGHRRKYTGACYTVHLEEVAALVVSIEGSPDMVAAEWLHDVVEDTQISHADIVDHFPATVAKLVEFLTDVSKPEDGNRKLRKAMDRDHLAGASQDAQQIKVCDLISNAQDICQHDQNFGRVFLSEKIALLDAMTKISSELRQKADDVIARCQVVLK